MQYEDILDRKIYSWSWDEPNVVEEFLDYAGSVDLSVPDYAFDIMGFWVRKSDGQVLYATDSGCSCPSPWEDTLVSDLRETTADRVVDLAAESHRDDGYDATPIADLRRQAREVQDRIRELGGK